ncbi:MAG: fibronectin type III domain-containing protein [Actinomycetota bacterium]|nr:fibronectin type III domain-containing protein [Actinomycetota bacterium]
MRDARRTKVAILAVLATMAVAIAAPGVAAAAGPPSATTNAATDVRDTSATLNATVFPNQDATTYHFQYGTTTAYGSQTPTEGPVNGNSGKDVSAAVTGLAPSTTYHYRVVATNSAGTAFGSDMTFTTAAAGTTPGPGPAPGGNAVTITATPTLLTFGRTTTIAGRVTGPDNGNVQVTLEENPYPYTGGFKATTRVATTNPAGAYSIVATPLANTRYRVTAKTRPPVTSPEVAVTVRVKVTLRLSDSTPRAGQRVRFSGVVTPGHDGKVARIQRRTGTGRWATVARAALVPTTTVNGIARSKYGRRVRINRSGTYRVRVTPADGDHARGTSPRRRALVG